MREYIILNAIYSICLYTVVVPDQGKYLTLSKIKKTAYSISILCYESFTLAPLPWTKYISFKKVDKIIWVSLKNKIYKLLKSNQTNDTET